MTGVEAWYAPERVRRFREFVQVVDGLLRGEELTFERRHYQVVNARLAPEPIQRPRSRASGPRLGHG